MRALHVSEPVKRIEPVKKKPKPKKKAPKAGTVAVEVPAEVTQTLADKFSEVENVKPVKPSQKKSKFKARVSKGNPQSVAPGDAASESEAVPSESASSKKNSFKTKSKLSKKLAAKQLRVDDGTPSKDFSRAATGTTI